jgi:hypothetical protein
MANLFEKPIAANPISEFAGLPLQFLAQAERQKTEDKMNSLKMTGMAQENLLQMKALSGDVPRLNEIVGKYEKRIDEASGNSPENAALETQKLMNEIRSNRELRAINSNYTTGTASLSSANDRYIAGKASKSGVTLSQMTANQFKTTQDEFGNYSTFKGYTPSNVPDVLGELTNILKDTATQYNEEGMKFKGKESMLSTLTANMQARPELEQSLNESFSVSYQEKPGVSRRDAYLNYRSAFLNKVVGDQSFKEVKQAAAGEGDYSGDLVMSGFQYNAAGALSDYAGGTASSLRGLIAKAGFNSTKKFTDFLGTSTGKFEIKSLEDASGVPFPKEYSDQVAYIEKHSSNPKVENIITEKVEKGLANSIINNKGYIKIRGQIKDQSGNIMDDNFVRENIEGSTKDGLSAQVVRRIKKGSGREGDYIIHGKDNQMYTMEARDFETISSPKYIHRKIAAVSDRAAYPTGRKTTKITTPFVVSGGENGAMIQPGVYESRRMGSSKNSKGETIPPYIMILQNDVPLYFTRGEVDSYGRPIYTQNKANLKK